ncbi:MAG: glycosyltransferase family 9 protein [Leptospiraceae bacterium]|nr:glycosyltransferase family 9 protein [Leptospiraceae bacterium]MDW7976185.1 glycosyltransferase family 9 protein [Leptospiraceae bacterium]
MKILIIKPGALGDTILIFDLLKNLCAHKFDVTFVGNADYINLIPYFDLGKSLSFDDRFFLPLFVEKAGESVLDEQLVDFFNSFSYVILIYHKLTDFYHKIERLYRRKLIYLKTLPDYLIPLRLYYTKEILGFLDLPVLYKYYHIKHIPQGKAIIIHPGSGSKEKIWNLENFIKLCKFLLQKNQNLVLIEGPAERGIFKHFSSFNHHPKVKFERINSLSQFIKIISYSTFYIGNDSGLTHLASFMGISGIAIFGKTNPWLWCPIPNIPAIYENKEDGIDFPSIEFVCEFLENYIDFI